MNAPTPQPSISVIVPTYRRPEALRRCLRHLADQRFPRDRFEIIVVDDGTGEPPEDAVAEVCGRVAVTLHAQPHTGPAAARNTGARHAAGEYLAFTDDDCAPAPDWLTSLTACWVEHPGAGVGGRTVNMLPTNLCAVVSQVIIDLAYDFYNSTGEEARFFASNNLAMPAGRFRELGGFDESFHWSEDRDICDRWRQAGYRLLFAPAAVVYHANALNWRRFCRQHFNYGRGAFRYHRGRARRGSGRLRDDIRFHAELPRRLAAVFAATPLRRWSGLAALLTAWQAANAVGYLYQQVRSHLSASER